MKWPSSGVLKSGTSGVSRHLSPNFPNGTVLRCVRAPLSQKVSKNIIHASRTRGFEHVFRIDFPKFFGIGEYDGGFHFLELLYDTILA